MSAIRICPRCRRGNLPDASFCSDCGTGIQRVRAAQPAVEPPPQPVMKVDARGLTHPVGCPACGAQLAAGDALIHVNGWLWDWSVLAVRLVFRLRGRRQKDPVLGYGEERLAARCLSCGGVWIGPPPVRRT